MTHYQTVLTTVLTKNLVTRQAIVAACKSEQLAYRAIKRAVEKKTIHARTVKYTARENRAYVIDYYTITVEGIRTLVRDPPEGYEWLAGISEDMLSRLSIVGRGRGDNDHVMRFLRESTAAVMAELAGADTVLHFITDGPCANTHDNGLTVSELVRSLIEKSRPEDRNKNEKEKTNTSPNELNYFDSRQVKALLTRKQSGVRLMEDYDIKRGRYSALLDSHFKSVLTYVCGREGLQWTPWLAQGDSNAAIMIQKEISQIDNRYKLENGVSGLLLVSNAQMFESIYNDSQKRRTSPEELGSYFEHLYVAPISEAGAAHVRWLMNTCNSEYEQDLINEAVENNTFKKGSEKVSGLFPLARGDGMEIFIGTAFDIKRIRRLAQRMKLNPDGLYGILAFPWQTDYYRRIFPRASIMEVEQ